LDIKLENKFLTEITLRIALEITTLEHLKKRANISFPEYGNIIGVPGGAL
jgi:hypothetical protein